MTTLTRLPRAQWRLLNLIVDHPQIIASEALQGADAAAEDLYELARAEMVSFRWKSGGEATVGHVEKTKATHGVRVTLRTAGVRWVISDPENTVLRCLAGRGARGMTCRELTRATDGDSGTAIRLHEQGLVVITTGERGDTPVRLKDSTDEWRVAITAAGRLIAISQ